MIAQDKAVSNNLTLDKDSKGIILTGSNTGGKSTFLRSLSSNLILAQGLGIACSESTVLTPFKLMYSSIHISDSLEKGVFISI